MPASSHICKTVVATEFFNPPSCGKMSGPLEEVSHASTRFFTGRAKIEAAGISFHYFLPFWKRTEGLITLDRSIVMYNELLRMTSGFGNDVEACVEFLNKEIGTQFKEAKGESNIRRHDAAVFEELDAKGREAFVPTPNPFIFPENLRAIFCNRKKYILVMSIYRDLLALDLE